MFPFIPILSSILKQLLQNIGMYELILAQLLYLFHIETSHLICSANQMTDFYMKCNIWIPVLKWKEILESNRLWFLICWKSKLKKKIFLKMIFLQNIHYLLKKCFYMEKRFCTEKSFTEKNINENVKKYISHLRNIFLCRKYFRYK